MVRLERMHAWEWEAHLHVVDLEVERAECRQARQGGDQQAALLLQHGGGGDGEAGEACERCEAGEAQCAGHEGRVEERSDRECGEPRQRRHCDMHAACILPPCFQALYSRICAKLWIQGIFSR